MTNALTAAQPTALTPAAEVTGLVGLLAGTVTESTAAMYRRDAAAFSRWAWAQGLSPLHPGTLAQWRTHLVTATNYSPNTINRMLSAVKRLVREGAAQGRVPQAVAVAFANVSGVKVRAMRKRTRKNARTRISAQAMRSIVEQPDANTLTGLRDRAFLLVLATSGIRVNEAVTLTVEQLEEREDGFGVMVWGKNREEAHFAPLTVEAWRAVQAWLKARPVESDYIFLGSQGRGNRFHARPLSPVGAWSIVKRHAKAGGLDGVKPHDFRRFVGTQLAQRNGVDVAQKVLGHKDARTTLNHYVLSEVRANVTEGIF